MEPWGCSENPMVTQWSFIVDLPIENGGSFHGYLSLTEDLFIHELEEMEIMWD